MSNVLPEGAGIIIGVGVGAAAAAALEPAIELPRQEAWQRNPNRLLDPGLLARLVAQGGVQLGVAQADAKRDGFDTDKLDALVYLAQTVPGVAEALLLWRRFDLPDALWTHSLVKAGLDARYLPYLNRLKTGDLVGLGDVAYAVVRGILPTPSWVPVAPPTTGDKVPRFPQVQIDPLVLAEKLGFDEDMLRIMVGRSGLSMAPIMAANALFRGIIGPNDYLLAIAEGDLRTEWADAVRETARQILTAGQYSEAELRGYTNAATRRANTRKHGMTDQDSDLLHLIQGRPLAIHQVTTGLARGGKLGGLYSDVPEPYQSAIRQSDIKEPWAGLAYANRYSYPSAFVLRSLAQAGDLGDTAAVAQILEEIGWKPSFAAQVAGKWAPTGAGDDPHVVKAQTQLWNTTHASYKAGEINEATVTATLPTAGVDPAAIPQVLAVWRVERGLIRESISSADIRKAYRKQDVNDATGVAWTIEEAVAALVARGWEAAEAHQYLEIG